jgi:hypothetical protein
VLATTSWRLKLSTNFSHFFNFLAAKVANKCFFFLI